MKKKSSKRKFIYIPFLSTFFNQHYTFTFVLLCVRFGLHFNHRDEEFAGEN